MQNQNFPFKLRGSGSFLLKKNLYWEMKPKYWRIIIYFYSATAVCACLAACLSFFRFNNICFFSSGVFFKPFILRVCNLWISCLPIWMRPILEPNASLEMFFFVIGLTSLGTLHASLKRSSEPNLVLLSLKSIEGPVSTKIMINIVYGQLHSYKQYIRKNFCQFLFSSCMSLYLAIDYAQHFKEYIK